MITESFSSIITGITLPFKGKQAHWEFSLSDRG
jgi:hypothetical protein